MFFPLLFFVHDNPIHLQEMAEPHEESEETKIEELREMLLGFHIHRTINEFEFGQFFVMSNDPLWVKTEELNFLLSEEVFTLLAERDPVLEDIFQRDPFNGLCSQSTMSSPKVQRSLVRLITNTAKKVPPTLKDYKRHTFLCKMLPKFLSHIHSVLLLTQDLNQVVNAKTIIDSSLRYLMNILKSKHWQTIQFVIKPLSICMKTELNCNNKSELKMLLQEFATFYCENKILTISDVASRIQQIRLQPIRFAIGFWARWYLDTVLVGEDLSDNVRKAR